MEGTLVWNGKTLQICYKSKKGKDTTASPRPDVLSELIQQKLKKNPAELHQQSVEIEVGANGQPFQIRLQDEDEIKDEIKASPILSETHTEPEIGEFHNPYNFVPVLPRQTAQDDLEDRFPVGHQAYFAECWSGTIAVKLTTEKPLLLHDAARMMVTENGHKIFPVRRGADGRPYLAPTMVKGMLRSAYEMITNSRLSIFTNHGESLAYRNPPSPARQADKNKPKLIPARVESTADGELLLHLLQYEKLKNYGYTVKLPRYRQESHAIDKGASRTALLYENRGYGNRELPLHGDKVWVTHNAKGVAQAIHRWQEQPPDQSGDWQAGWVCVTGANMNTKKYERVFILERNDRYLKLNKTHQQLWKQLICNYKLVNKRALKQRQESGQAYDDYLGDEPGKTAWSRHIWQEESEILQPGTLCYVVLNSKSEITALAPVTIPRQLYSVAPEKLLDDSLKPAIDLSKLSPGDRVFGWANPQGRGAHKGQLRVVSVQCEKDGESAIETLDPPVPLAILSSPKPEQSRFYVAQDRQGAPLSRQAEKAKGYAEEHGIRGRKVYPHHHKLEAREWHRTGDENQDDQNCSIQGWVKPKISFSSTLEVTNLSSVELGALLWMLTQDGHYYRLGAGKPLGFGSVQLKVDWDNTRLCRGTQWQTFYHSLSHNLPPGEDAQGCIQLYEEAFCKSYGQGQPFNEIPLIQAFCQAARGFEDGLPIHYPRLYPERKAANGEDYPIYEWFGENEKLNQETPGMKLPLPPLWNETGLPYHPVQVAPVPG